ncbi:MAG: flavin reductase [Firmicutes bacterium]|nr:flavin reductase [Bacillota bacterium]
MENKVLRNLSYGMYIVGSKSDRAVGCIVNTVVQITSEPKTIAVSINHDNYTNEVIKKTNKFSISILSEDTNPEIIGTFGYKTSKEIDKYKNINIKELEGLPVLIDSCGNIICKVISTMETSTHTVFLGEIIAMDNYKECTPMTYKYYHEVLKLKSPKNAPTYIEEKENKKTVWKCSICGYEVEIDELSSDYVCPICKQPASAFEKIN